MERFDINSLAIDFSGSVNYAGVSLFESVSLQLGPGQWTCLLGASGVGKSTILRLIAGLPGVVEFGGRIDASDGGEVSTRVSYMAQSDLLFPWLNVIQNVVVGQRMRGEKVDTAAAETMIQRVGLGRHANKKPYQLSGGMRQRAALARTLMEDTPVVLLDEPFSALDGRTRAEMQELAFEVLEGKTVLLVTHDPAEAVKLAHRFYIMSRNDLRLYEELNSLPVRAMDDQQTLDVLNDLLVLLNSAVQPQ